MFRTHTSISAQTSPLLSDWTIGELVAWISADDARCHDESLRTVLDAIDAWSGGTGGLRPTGTVALVRAIAARLREDPTLAQVRVRDAEQHHSRSGGRVPPARAAASTLSASSAQTAAAPTPGPGDS